MKHAKHTQNTSASRAISEVARKNGIPVEKVRQEISFAIEDAFIRGKAENHPFWKDRTEVPTPEEMIEIVAKMMNGS